MADPRICSIPACCKRHKAKGYCGAHYVRFLKHGDPLGGGTSHGDPLRFIHEVALLHTSDDCLKWPFSTNAWGYGKLSVDGKIVAAHRYICELVDGVPPTAEHEAAHSCGKGHEGCVAPDHLSWKTRAENEADKLAHGTRLRGERHGNAKLTEADVREILGLRGVEPQCRLAKRFMVSDAAISRIFAGHAWACLSGEFSA